MTSTFSPTFDPADDVRQRGFDSGAVSGYAYTFSGELAGRQVDEDLSEYEPDEIFDSVTAQMLQRRLDYVPGTYEPLPYGEPLPYSPFSAPSLLRKALRSPAHALDPAEEQALISRAQAGDGEALLALIGSYSPTLSTRSRRLARQSGMTFDEADAWLLYRFTEAVMEFDCGAADESARLAGSARGAGATRPLSFYLQDAEWDDRLIAAPVTINRQTLSEFYAAQERAVSANGNVDSMSEWLDSTTRLTAALARQVAHLLTPKALCEHDSLSHGGAQPSGDSHRRAVAPAHLVTPADVDDRAGSAHVRSLADEVLAGLDEDDRHMVRALFGFDGEPVPHGVYGREVGLSRTGVSSRLHRLIDRLREGYGTPTRPAEQRSPSPYSGRHRVKPTSPRAVALSKVPTGWRPSRKRLMSVYAESGQSVAAVLQEAEALATSQVRGRASSPTDVSVLREWVQLVAREATLEVCGD